MEKAILLGLSRIHHCLNWINVDHIQLYKQN